MQVDVTVAMISAVAALIVAVLGFVTTRFNQRDLARLKNRLSAQTAQQQARLEYELEARKRLYRECAPVLFELAEASERAKGRIAGLARASRDGVLEPGPASWLQRKYYCRSTYYRMIAPMALIKSFRARLTDLDLALDPVYLLAVPRLDTRHRF